MRLNIPRRFGSSWFNKIFCENCLDTMSEMPDGLVDLVVTSPPYDDLRSYDGKSLDPKHFRRQFPFISQELFRVLRPGGVLIWVVADQVIAGGESGSSLRQALRFQNLGFRIHDTMIYLKTGMAFPSKKRYHQAWEYMFVFSKGELRVWNGIKDRPNKFVGRTGGNRRGGVCEREAFGLRFNVWSFANGKLNSTKDTFAHEHPAIFPEALAADHIRSWSNRGDIVYDPFMGSGTTAKMAKQLGRVYIGSELSARYVKLAQRRLKF